MSAPIKLTRESLSALAETIRPIEPHAARVAFVQRLLPHLYAGHARFDAIRFVKACNVASLIDGDEFSAPVPVDPYHIHTIGADGHCTVEYCKVTGTPNTMKTGAV